VGVKPVLTVNGKLYLNPNSHWRRVKLALLELNIRINKIRRLRTEEQKMKFKKKNPIDTVPLLDIEGVRISENCAIVLFLIDKYDEIGTFGGKPGSPLRANLYKWCAICSPIDDIFKKEEDLEKKKNPLE